MPRYLNSHLNAFKINLLFSDTNICCTTTYLNGNLKRLAWCVSHVAWSIFVKHASENWGFILWPPIAGLLRDSQHVLFCFLQQQYFFLQPRKTSDRKDATMNHGTAFYHSKRACFALKWSSKKSNGYEELEARTTGCWARACNPCSTMCFSHGCGHPVLTLTYWQCVYTPPAFFQPQFL